MFFWRDGSNDMGRKNSCEEAQQEVCQKLPLLDGEADIDL